MKTNYLFAIVAVALTVTSLPLWASETDALIEAAVAKSYVFKTYLVQDAIKTSSKDGAVTLTGTVAEESHKALAQHTVGSLPGVKSVDNKLEVKGEIPVKNSDGWISVQVKQSLLLNRNVSASKTGVYVKDGIVTLKGEATSEAQKELTTEYAKDVEGVKNVMNEMTVAVAQTPEKTAVTAAEIIDDASITAQIRTTLLLHSSTSSFNTTVATKEGVVTLGGTAKNAAEKDLVTKLVNNIYGVKSVVNNMTIVESVATN